MNRRRIVIGRRGFSFVEIVLSLAIVGIVVTAVGGVYVSGLRAEEETLNRVPAESHIRSALERAIATHYGKLSTASMPIWIDGKLEILTRRVSAIDLDGDGAKDNGIKLVTVIFLGDSLSTLVVDTNDEIEKIP